MQHEKVARTSSMEEKKSEIARYANFGVGALLDIHHGPEHYFRWFGWTVPETCIVGCRVLEAKASDLPSTRRPNRWTFLFWIFLKIRNIALEIDFRLSPEQPRSFAVAIASYAGCGVLCVWCLVNITEVGDWWWSAHDWSCSHLRMHASPYTSNHVRLPRPRASVLWREHQRLLVRWTWHHLACSCLWFADDLMNMSFYKIWLFLATLDRRCASYCPKLGSGRQVKIAGINLLRMDTSTTTTAVQLCQGTQSPGIPVEQSILFCMCFFSMAEMAMAQNSGTNDQKWSCLVGKPSSY